jgi:hypothetical protein
MDRSLFDVVLEAASAVAEAGLSARVPRSYPRAADRAPVAAVAAPVVVKAPRSYPLPADRVRVVVAVRKGGRGK